MAHTAKWARIYYRECFNHNWKRNYATERRLNWIIRYLKKNNLIPKEILNPEGY